MVSSLVKALLHGENFPLTACEQIWDFLYIEDVIEALVLALENDAVHGIYNLASGSPICLRNFVEIIRDTINPNLSLSIGQLEYRPDQVMHLEGNSSKLQAASGWTPHVKIREGIERTVAWHRKESV
jgi:nucleoside-diphosphate-sugar epimerase